MAIEKEQSSVSTKTKSYRFPWVWDFLLIGILLIGAFFRFTGVDWDEGYHLHPDERFLTMVETSIQPVDSLKQYFDTAASTLNPNNAGYTFYVYGTLPLFIVRYVAGWFGQSGYDQVNVVGRVLSGLFDLGTLVFVYLIGKRLYRNARLGLLAALFASLAVLQIQISHYFTVDNFANFFTYAAIYTAVFISTSSQTFTNDEEITGRTPVLPKFIRKHWGSFVPFAFFGILYGMALACKVSIWALALLLPLAAFIYYSKLPSEKRYCSISYLARNLVLAGFLAVLAFRIFQPYAFSGPGFFGLHLNPNWISNLKELSAQSAGDIDVPYALQWARRPLTFAIKNLTLWGLGLPLGVLSLGGLIWMAWRSIRGDWQKHMLILGWAGFILITQSLNWVRSMRYLLPAYPALALIASWTLFKLFEGKPAAARKLRGITINWRKVLTVTAAVLTITGTGAWAYAFRSIYTRPVTRVAASEWIYENIPAAINLKLTLPGGDNTNQQLAYQNSALVSSTTPLIYGFTAQSDLLLSSINLEHVLNQAGGDQPISLLASVAEKNGDVINYLTSGFTQSTFTPISSQQGDPVIIQFQQPIALESKKTYQLEIVVVEPDYWLRLSGGAWLEYQGQPGKSVQYLPPPVYRLSETNPYQVSFFPIETSDLKAIHLNRVVDLLHLNNTKQISATLVRADAPEDILGRGTITASFLPGDDPRGEAVEIVFDEPVTLIKSVGYMLQFSLKGEGELGIFNSIPVMESTWDDAIPLSMHGYNQWGYWDGLYGNVRNLELYWDDNETKRTLLQSTLDQSDAIFISSNRQWGTIPRVGERYPLTSAYYRALIGCPEDKDLLWCYSVAQPGMFSGSLGFELTAVFQNDPEIGPLKINDQFAEEAFTVYDHPKVLIFQKTAQYDPQKVQEILDSVDLTLVVKKTPRQASDFSGDLKLTGKELQIQRNGGTWAQLFPSNSLLNRSPLASAVAWYLAILLLGMLVFPITRNVLRGLPDMGYGFSRLVGLLLLAYFTFIISSFGGTFSRFTIIGVLVVLVIVSLVLVVKQKESLLAEIRARKKVFLAIEIVFLILFLIDLGIRIGNPDLWHPWKGGEKPMDLSYFTAVLKSTTFPPYDPWYSGGYINYYYYGFVIAAVPVKLLGIRPDLAYNLIIPTLFALTGIGAFGIGWNLFARKSIDGKEKSGSEGLRALAAGVTATFFLLILGNLGTLKMIWQGVQKLAAPGGVIDNAGILSHLKWVVQGLGRFFTGAQLPVGIGEWYWNPSRAIPGDVITEFPLFTFIYSDLHAHMIALPITLLALGWVVSILNTRIQGTGEQKKSRWISLAVSVIFGGLVIGTLRPTNTWDLPTYLLLAAIALFYASFRYVEPPPWFLGKLHPTWRSLLYAACWVFLFAMVSFYAYQPFTAKYGQAYGNIDTWTGDHSPLGSYLVHWGWQFLLIATWFTWETREWLASTPLSNWKKIKPYLVYVQLVGFLFLIVLVMLSILGISVGWIVGILGIWALILMLRPGQADAKRLVYFLVGTGLILTLFVELFALSGDIGRMNTVFKFYYQAWTMFSISAAASLVWLFPVVTEKWKTWIANLWQAVLAFLLICAALYPFFASFDKIRDRMSMDAPAGLDGTAFMATSRYYDAGIDIVLSEDYAGIQWMRENVIGSPVIVEANTVEYRWGNRYTIYTGLPGVLGWNWHQRQQRGFLDYNGIADRLNEIPYFYQTDSAEDALRFLEKYQVSYIILGQVERAYYPGTGLDKFETFDGVYWQEIFRINDTVIYQVLDPRRGS